MFVGGYAPKNVQCKSEPDKSSEQSQGRHVPSLIRSILDPNNEFAEQTIFDIWIMEGLH